MSRYYVRLRIGDMKCENEATKKATAHSLYNVGRSLVRWGKRNHVRVTFAVTDLNTRKSVFHLYSRDTRERGWIARQIGVYDNI